MLKSVALYVANRLFIMALLTFAMNAYFRTSCGGGGSLIEQVQRALAGLSEISRALH
jgi:hypothetical protein